MYIKLLFLPYNCQKQIIKKGGKGKKMNYLQSYLDVNNVSNTKYA